jgi:hypothetical protein
MAGKTDNSLHSDLVFILIPDDGIVLEAIPGSVKSCALPKRTMNVGGVERSYGLTAQHFEDGNRFMVEYAPQCTTFLQQRDLKQRYHNENTDVEFKAEIDNFTSTLAFLISESPNLKDNVKLIRYPGGDAFYPEILKLVAENEIKKKYEAVIVTEHGRGFGPIVVEKKE